MKALLRTIFTAKIELLACLSATILMLLCALPCNGATAPENIPEQQMDRQIVFKEIEIKGLHSIREKELLYLLDISRDKPVLASAIRTGIKRAFLKGIFSDIRIELSHDKILSITVVELPVIKSINISDNSVLSKKEAVKISRLKKGDRLHTGKIEKGIGYIQEAIQKRGYPLCKVSYVMSAEGSRKIALLINITPGTPQRIKSVQIIGDDDKQILTESRLKIGDVYDQTVVDEEAGSIKEDLKKKGYINSSVKYAFEDSTLQIKISKGKRLNIDFEGNKAISTANLRKEMPFGELNSFSFDLLEETVARLVSLYHADGFPESQIAPIVSEKKNEVSIKFFINEGSRYKIADITIEGATLPKERLSIATGLSKGDFYNPDTVSSGSDPLRELYRSLGYLSVEVKEPSIELRDDRAYITYRVTEGIQTKVGAVEFRNNEKIATQRLLSEIPLKKGNPYSETDTANSKAKILDLYHKAGLLDTQVQISLEKSQADDLMAVVFTVKEGQKVLFGKTIIVGNEDTKEDVIKRGLVHREDEPFNYGLLLSERQKLYRTGLFSGVDIVPTSRYDQHRDVLYRVEEGDAGAVEFGGGYGEYERVRGFLDISYKNLFGMNREISYRTELSTLNRRFILSFFDPWFMHDETAFRVQLMNEYKKEMNIDNHDTRYRLMRYSGMAGLEKKLTEKLKGELYYELAMVKTYDVAPDIVLSKEDTGTLLVSGVKGGLIFDSRDNAFDPRSGILTGFSYKIATKILFSETEFQKTQAYFNSYHALTKWLVLALSMRGGYAWSFDKTFDLPLFERFFLGGRTTVRGYDQDLLGPRSSQGNPLGGNLFLMGNAELRIDVWRGFGLVAFFDGGDVWQRPADFAPQALKYTTGLGLRYNTPVGPIRVDYGHKLTRQKGEGRGAFHFSVGHAF